MNCEIANWSFFDCALLPMDASPDKLVPGERVGFDELLARLAADTDGFLARDGVRHEFAPSQCGFRCKSLATTLSMSFPYQTVRGHASNDYEKPFSMRIYNCGLHCAAYASDPLHSQSDYDRMLAAVRLCLLGVHETDLYRCDGCRRAFATYRDFVAHERHQCAVCNLPFDAMCARQYHGGREITFGRAHPDGVELCGWHRGVHSCALALPADSYVCPDCLLAHLPPEAFFTHSAADERRDGFDALMARLAQSTGNFGGHVFVPCWRGFYCATLHATIELQWPAAPNRERTPDYTRPFNVTVWSPLLAFDSGDSYAPLTNKHGYERLVQWLEYCVEPMKSISRGYACDGCSCEFSTYRDFVAHEQHHCAACDRAFRAMCARYLHGGQEIVYGKVSCFRRPHDDFAVIINLCGWFMGEYYSRRSFAEDAFVCPDCLHAMHTDGVIEAQWSH